MSDCHKDEPGTLIVYGHDYCGHAHALARALEEHDIDHEWRDIIKGDPSWRDELKALASGHLSVPTLIFPDGLVMIEPRVREVLEKLGISEN